MFETKGDLLDGEWDIAVTCCNLYHTFGAGIAKTIKEKFPEVYAADCDTVYGDDSRLGTFTYANVGTFGRIFNLYAMIGIGNDGDPLNRNLSYDHFYNGMYRICEQLSLKNPRKTHIIGVPRLIGCQRAGGNWKIVQAILEQLESEFMVTFHVYEFDKG